MSQEGLVVKYIRNPGKNTDFFPESTEDEKKRCTQETSRTIEFEIGLQVENYYRDEKNSDLIIIKLTEKSARELTDTYTQKVFDMYLNPDVYLTSSIQDKHERVVAHWPSRNIHTFLVVIRGINFRWIELSGII